MTISSLQVRGSFGAVVLPLFLATSLLGCGGGNSGSGLPPTSAPSPLVLPPPPVADLQVVVTDTERRPLEGVGVSLNGCFNGRTTKTSSDGVVQFTAVPTCGFGSNPGSVSIEAFHSEYFTARSTLQLEAGMVNEQRIAMEHGSAIAVGVLGTQVVDRVDGGRKLMIEAQLAIVGPDGQLRAGLTDSAFSVPSLECGWGDCGVWLPDGSASFGVGEARTAEPGSVVRVAGQARSSYAAGLLLDESASMVRFDPAASRRTGGKRFLSAVSAPNSVALAVSHGEHAPPLNVLGAYASDGTSHLGAIDQLTTGSGESNVLPAISALVDYAAASAPAIPSVARRSIVALGLGYWEGGCASGRSPACTAVRATAARTRANDIDVVTIGQWHHMAEIATQTRGAFFYLANAAQLETTLAVIDGALARTLDHYTVRFLIDLQGPTAIAGTVLYQYVKVRVKEATDLFVPLVVVVD